MPKHDDPTASRYTPAELSAWTSLAAATIEVAGLRLFVLVEADPKPHGHIGFAQDLLRYYWRPQIDYALEGEDLGWANGPVAADGWYIDPYCNPACCRPEGPFSSWPEALIEARRDLQKKVREQDE